MPFDTMSIAINSKIKDKKTKAYILSKDFDAAHFIQSWEMHPSLKVRGPNRTQTTYTVEGRELLE